MPGSQSGKKLLGARAQNGPVWSQRRAERKGRSASGDSVRPRRGVGLPSHWSGEHWAVLSKVMTSLIAR